MILLFVLMIVAMYFLLIRPQQKRKREQQQMQSNAGIGAEIMTLGGLYGTIVDTDDESITIEVAPGVTNRYAKGAIARVVTPADQVADADDEDDEIDEDYVEESDAAVEPELADVVEEPAEDESPAKKTKKEEVGASNQALPRDPTAN
jgi:preprotein translocase subunit YajC